MYIRRKVFSIILDENGEEKLFSTTEFINEETYLQREFTSTKELIAKAADGDKDAEKKLRNRLGDNVATTAGVVTAVPSAVVGGGLARNSSKLVKRVGKNHATIAGAALGTSAGLIGGALASQKLAKAAATKGADQEIETYRKSHKK